MNFLRQRPVWGALYFLFFWVAATGVFADSPSNSLPTFAALPSPAPSLAPGAPGQPMQMGPMLPAPTPTLSPAVDRAALLREFTNAQKSSIAAMKHQNSMELKMLDAAQSAAYKDWWAKEVQKRRQYFEAHSAGKDKRTYVQDMNARRKTFVQIQKDERARRVQEQKTRLDSEQEAQMHSLKDFNDAIKAGQVPPQRLWPQTH